MGGKPDLHSFLEWKDIKIFISSTFNDMHAERDYLVKSVFPELAEWCEQRKLRLIDIDLRWGITKADSEANDTIRKCLNGIDESRPFFLCFLGQRRGWVPNDPRRLSYENEMRKKRGDPEIKTEISEETKDEYKRVGDLSGKSSVTEMEIEHALLNPMIRMVNDKDTAYEEDRHTLFFFRKNPFDETLSTLHRHLFLNDAVSVYGDNPEKATEKLEEFKNKVRARFQSQIIDYTCIFNRQDGIMTPELRIPGLEGEEKEQNDELCKGRLTKFSIHKSCLNEQILYQLKQEYPKQLSNESIELKYIVIAGLMAEISAEYQDRKAPVIEQENRYRRDLEQQELFIQNASDGFVPVPEVCDRLNNYVFEDDDRLDDYRKPLLLAAEAGLGKSTILAHCLKTWQEDRRLSGSRFFSRFCGVSDMSSDVYGLWNSIARQAGIEAPASLDELRRQFLPLLKELSQNRRTVIVIDAVNQMRGGTDLLDWLPDRLPEGVKLIVSIKQDADSIVQIEQWKRKLYAVPLKAIRNDGEGLERKRMLITGYLKKNLKALDDSHILTICKNEASGNPLFLKILLSELRVFGAFRQLNDEISRYGHTPQEAFRRVLERLESDTAYDVATPKEYVSFLFGLLAHARKGLSEKELIRCFEKVFPPESTEFTGSIRYFIRQVRPFFTRHNGRFDFLYDAFREAAKEKYGFVTVNNIQLHKTGWHDRLARSLYDSRPGECAYHARKANNREYLTSIYTDPDFLNRYYHSEGAYSLKSESHLVQQGIIPGEIMRFIDDTAVILEKNADITPATFYKELSSGFKASAEKLCVAPWIRMDRVDTGITENRIESVKPVSMQIETVNSGCIAGNRKEAFLLTTQNTVKIISLDSMQTLSTFTLETDSPVEKLFSDSDGCILVAVMRESFAAFEMQRDKSGGVLSCILRTTKKCRRIRFGGTLAFAGGNSLVYQTPEYAVKSLSLCGSLEEQSIGNDENALAGYFQKQQRYLLYKTAEGYRLTCTDSANMLSLDSSINDVICLNGKLYVLPNDRYMLICDPLELEVEARVELGFVPWSAVLFNDSLLLSDEHGAIYTWHPQKGVKSHGMLAVEWDKNPTLFPAGMNRTFYFSNNRYALLAGISSSEYQILQATLKDVDAGMLLVHSSHALTFRKNGRTVELTNPFRGNQYGMTSLLNYMCAWNPQGDMLSMGNGRTAVLDFADGTQRNIAEPDSLSTIISILWVNGIDAFVILYSGGDIRIVKSNGRIIKTGAFQSSTRNYLTCACGNYFCVLTKRRLVHAVTLFEEEAVTVLDKDGRHVYEDHFQGTERQTYKDLVYDSSQKKLYLISDMAACVLSMSAKFIATKISFDVPFRKKPVGLAAKDGILYYANIKGEICTIDLNTGKQFVHLPLHRNVSYLQSSDAGNQIVLVENNERVYSIQINNKKK
ncbi:MAG: DUF4062 domain-containing protein [Tannerella sp.]|jgi:hypothetical protein|nr:DUF4062 domain-containing protein [Tannerella sp.]